MTIERFPVEAGHIMMFARAIGDTNPIYFNAQYAAGTELGAVIAPPTFVQSNAQFDDSYLLRPVPGEPWFGSGRTPAGKPSPRANHLHAEQHYTYHRPLKAGDVLTITVRQNPGWEKQGRRGGKLVFSETITEYHDADGEIVVTARGVSVKTEKVIEQGAS